MTHRLARVLALGAALCGLLFSSACSKHQPLEPITVEEIPAAAAETFQDAGDAAKQVLAAALASLEKKDYVTSWNLFQDLAVVPDLNKAQRQLAARAVSAVGGKMQEAEAAGDERAAQARQFHRENK